MFDLLRLGAAFPMPRYALEVLAFLIAVVWLFGWLVTPIGSDFIHLLLVLVIALIAIRFVPKRAQ
jgi:hypothetical protein